MQTSTTWEQVERAVSARRASSFDRQIRQNDLRMADSGVLLVEGEEYGFTESGLEQLARRAGIPTVYAKRLREEDPALLAHNFNRWLPTLDGDKTILLRGLDTGSGPLARAFLSDKYGIMDDHEVLEAAHTALQTNGLLDRLTVTGFSQGMNSFHLRLIDNSGMTDARDYLRNKTGNRSGGFVNKAEDPDFVTSMLHVSNSEIGRSAVRVEGGAYRIVCTNGMLAPLSGGAFSKKHFGFTSGGLNAYVVGKAEEILRSAAALTKRLVESQGEVLDNPVEAVERIVQQNRVSKREQTAILGQLGIDPLTFDRAELDRPFTAYDLVNAITATARDLNDPDARATLERVAASALDG